MRRRCAAAKRGGVRIELPGFASILAHPARKYSAFVAPRLSIATLAHSQRTIEMASSTSQYSILPSYSGLEMEEGTPSDSSSSKPAAPSLLSAPWTALDHQKDSHILGVAIWFQTYKLHFIAALSLLPLLHIGIRLYVEHTWANADSSIYKALGLAFFYFSPLALLSVVFSEWQFYSIFVVLQVDLCYTTWVIFATWTSTETKIAIPTITTVALIFFAIVLLISNIMSAVATGERLCKKAGGESKASPTTTPPSTTP